MLFKTELWLKGAVHTPRDDSNSHRSRQYSLIIQMITASNHPIVRLDINSEGQYGILPEVFKLTKTHRLHNFAISSIRGNLTKVSMPAME